MDSGSGSLRFSGNGSAMYSGLGINTDNFSTHVVGVSAKSGEYKRQHDVSVLHFKHYKQIKPLCCKRIMKEIAKPGL